MFFTNSIATKYYNKSKYYPNCGLLKKEFADTKEKALHLYTKQKDISDGSQCNSSITSSKTQHHHMYRYLAKNIFIFPSVLASWFWSAILTWLVFVKNSEVLVTRFLWNTTGSLHYKVNRISLYTLMMLPLVAYSCTDTELGHGYIFF